MGPDSSNATSLRMVNLLEMNKQLSKKGFLNKKELAEYLGLSVFTIDTWVSQQREIPFVKMGRRVMFDMEDVSGLKGKRSVPDLTNALTT